MALQQGMRLGAYEIISPLGSGGMGEVYHTRDTKLQRDVALKILPETMARDAQRMARFEREAQVLASLNHPNIAAIYGMEESNGIRALAMELVEGQTLAESISVAAVSSPPGGFSKTRAAGEDTGATTGQGRSGVGEGEALPYAPPQASPLRRSLPWAGMIVFAIVAALLAIGYVARAPKQQPVTRFTVAPPENATLFADGEASLSPDGRKLAFVMSPSPGQPQQLWVRPLDSLTAQRLQGTEGGTFPFWSPDGNVLGFYANRKLEKIAVSGGPPLTLCEAQLGGATWSKSGVIVFTNVGGLYRVAETGGTPTLVAAPDRARGELVYRLPQFLADGRRC